MEKEAAIDFVKHGRIKDLEGMEEYQKTSEEMNTEPFTNDEMEDGKELKEFLSEGEKTFHWARKCTGFSKLEKLREVVGFSKWSSNYKLVSRNVHADFRQMDSLFAMEEASETLLLVGPSNSGLTLPAHMTAITMNQITNEFSYGLLR